MNKRRLRAKPLILLPFLALVAVLATYTSLPGIDAIVQPAPQSQTVPPVLASYRMQGSFTNHDFTVHRTEWRMTGGKTAGHRIDAALNPETIVEFFETGTYQFTITAFYDNNGFEASVQDSMTIQVLAAESPPPAKHPEVDAGPDVTLREGVDFAR